MATTKKAIVRYDRVPYPNPVSIKNTGAAALEAGKIIGLKGLVTGERELYTVGDLAAGDTVAMVAPSILFYDETKTEFDWELNQNEVCRAYILQKGEMYTIAKRLAGGVVSAGDKVTINTVDVAVVRELVSYEGQESVVIEII